MTIEDTRLLEAFESKTLSLDQWNQTTHVSIAFLYLQQYDIDEATQRMKQGVIAFNEHNKIVESETSGYNETTTVAFMHIIDSVMKNYGKVFPVDNSRDFCETHPQLLSKHILRLFYSPERRMDPRAKREFVEPDLAPLPKGNS
ncbi:MAG: hypothetical protein P1V20_14870 [Verrucomicrobiales bacterium]|nr:hypothetical protein [Verrucomicrobiales bacterium]